jgi:hypothetical protein
MSWSFAVIAKVLIHRLVVTQICHRQLLHSCYTRHRTELYGLFSPARNPLTVFTNLLIAPLLHCDRWRPSLCDIASRVLRVRVNLGLCAGERTTSVTAQQLMTALALQYSVPNNSLFLSSHLLMCVCVNWSHANAIKRVERVAVWLYPLLTSALDGDELPGLHHSRCTSGEQTLVPVE